MTTDDKLDRYKKIIVAISILEKRIVNMHYTIGRLTQSGIYLLNADDDAIKNVRGILDDDLNICEHLIENDS